MVEGARVHLPVVVIDDGSTDDTAARAEAAGATVLLQRPNAGKGAALRVGFRHALVSGAAAVVTLDADGQHDPAEIPRFLDAFHGIGTVRPELVIGRRDFGSMPLVRRLANTLGGWVFSAAIGRRIADNQSGYRLIGRRLMTALLDSEEAGFEFEVEMIARCIALGLPIAEIPVRTIYAGESSHIRPWAHFRNFLRVSRSARRLVRSGRAGRDQPQQPGATVRAIDPSVPRSDWLARMGLDTKVDLSHTKAMQQYDGKPNSEIDGSPPDPYSPPSWRGTLAMLAVIVVLLGLMAYAFLSWSNTPAGQEFHIPGF